jgi:hypothetical protein
VVSQPGIEFTTCWCSSFAEVKRVRQAKENATGKNGDLDDEELEEHLLKNLATKLLE